MVRIFKASIRIAVNSNHNLNPIEASKAICILIDELPGVRVLPESITEEKIVEFEGRLHLDSELPPKTDDSEE